MSNQTKPAPPTIKDFLNGKVKFDEFTGGYFWLEYENKEIQMIAEIRGYGAIQNLFIQPDKTVDFNKADAFQDELGKFIADAINEKIERDFKTGKP